jgi:glycosyltransferase involved in cell wall biosynthesis
MNSPVSCSAPEGADRVPDRLNIVSVCRAFPTPVDPSGGIFVLNRVAAMARQSNLHALQPVPYFPWINPLPEWARPKARVQAGLPIEHAPMFYIPRVLKSLDAAWLARAVEARIDRLHRTRPIDLIDAHFGYPEGAACVDIGRRLGIPVVVTIRGFENEYASRHIVGRRMRKALTSAAGVIAVSRSLERLAIEWGVTPDRVRVVHNAIDAQVFKFEDPQYARERLCVPANCPLLVSVGHLVSRKRHHVLIEAFARVRERVPDAKLVIVGARSFERAYPDELVAQAADLRLTDHVRFLGNRPQVEVVDWLRAASVFALATAREGCCNAVLEALAVGAPVVTTPAGDNTEFVAHPHNGMLVPVDNIDSLTEALVEALTRRAWNRQGISARLHAQVGEWTDVAAKVIDFFGRVVRSERSGSQRLAFV